jgi:hypothetical protein
MLRLPVFLAAATLLAYLYNRLHDARFKKHAKFPQLPRTLLLGHLKAFGEAITQNGPTDRHPGTSLSLPFSCLV